MPALIEALSQLSDGKLDGDCIEKVLAGKIRKAAPANCVTCIGRIELVSTLLTDLRHCRIGSDWCTPALGTSAQRATRRGWRRASRPPGPGAPPCTGLPGALLGEDPHWQLERGAHERRMQAFDRHWRPCRSDWMEQNVPCFWPAVLAVTRLSRRALVPSALRSGRLPVN